MKPHLKTVLWVVSGDAGARVIGFVVTAYLARTLGPSSFGVMSVGLAILAYLSQISGAGLQTVETRNVAKMGAKGHQRLGIVLSFRFVLAVALSALTGFIIVIFFPADDTTVAVWLSTLILIPLAISPDWFLQGREEFGPLGVSKVIVAGLYGILVFFLVKGQGDYAIAIISFALGTLAGAIFLLYRARRSLRTLKLSMNPREWIEIGRSSAFVGLAMLAGQSAVNLGPIILAFLIGNLEAGVFSAAMKLVLVVLLLDRALNSILLPLASRIHSQRPEEFQGFIRLVFKFVFSLIFPVAVCCGILAPWLVHLVFGDGYEGAVPHTRFLLGYVVLTLLNSVLMCSLLAAGEELRYSRLLLIGSIILAALVGLLTVLLGPVGAGLGVSLGELVMFAILLTTARRIMQIDLSGITLRFVVVGGLALGALILIPLTNPVGLIPFFTLFFFLTLMLVGVMTVREVRVLAGKII